MTFLQVAWFFLVGVLLTGYVVLDGFDLGVGFWYLFTKREEDRAVMRGAIAPFWDGNEVWLLAGGGALFAAFPPVYAAAFSGFYLVMVLIVLALVLRAVSLELRHHFAAAAARRLCDAGFAGGSVAAALLLAAGLGNVLGGIPLDERGFFMGRLPDLFNPFALVVAAAGVAVTATHGALFVVLKSEGELRARALRWAGGAWKASVALFAAAGFGAIFMRPHLVEGFRDRPALWAVVAAAVAAMSATGYFIRAGSGGRAFAASCASIAGMMGTAGASLFPRLLPNRADLDLSLTVAGASSSEHALGIMLVVAGIGMPVVIGYTIWVYRTFRGKVDVDY